MPVKTTPLTYTVNGVKRRSLRGTQAIKPHYGKNFVLLRVASDPMTPSASSTIQDLYPRVVDYTICAVDRRGRFLVDDGGTYVVGTLRDEETMEAQCTAQLATVKASVTSRRCPKLSLPRAPTKCSRFIGTFLATFSMVGFSEAISEWRQLSAERKKTVQVEALISAVKASGRYTLRQSETSQSTS